MTVYKKPFEQFGIEIDFSADVGAGNTVASITAVKATNQLTGADSTTQVIASTPAPSIVSPGNTGVAFEVTGGAAGETHTIAVQIVSSIGEKYQGEITLRIVA